MQKLTCLFLSCLALTSTGLLAQDTIPNASFERWANFGNYQDPEDWGTINALTATVNTFTATKATASADVHDGSFALRLETKSIFGQTAPGIAATGIINSATQAVDGGFAFVDRPTGIKGWFKYTPSGTDTASVDVELSRWDTTNNQRVKVGEARFEATSTVSNYTEFTAAFDFSSSDDPDTAIIVLLSSSDDNPQIGSVLLVDGLSFTSAPLGVETVEAKAVSQLHAVPNPAVDRFWLPDEVAANGQLQLFNKQGQLVNEASYWAGRSVEVSGWQPGIYLFELRSQGGALIGAGKVLKK